ncbi:FAD-dependent monooxygenase [Roseomonas xinghualingensis]|uniref:FAD-dependent monooxygenase n=1 Tax=Roseomonas xinghualingensis TaxID=2986475 RepID=UPI0021F23BD4|nr:FAD-dependent monooxygenase [Roseomonas sp. SXEYE001]MCV4209956.1 FAD-dependent monooxygenase [Roseomonas sp. SXEYE001]
MPYPQVLIVGAGPTGLVLALWLVRLGVRIRIIDKAAEPGTTSRAVGVQARTLEFYEQLGLAEPVVARGTKFTAANLWVRGSKVARADFGKMGKGLSPYPYMLIFPQDEHERFLIAQLEQEGVTVERRTELLDFEEGQRVQVRLKRPDGDEEVCEADYLAGCDGARSQLRRLLGVGFPGGTYQHLFYVADALGSGPIMNGELHVALDEADFLAAFPMKDSGHARLIGMAEASGDGQEALSWRDIGKLLLGRLDTEIKRVSWFSTYHVHHRVADRFRQGRAFLLGDAAHIHSPVGGQGMNTGIADAVNLAWKLAAVLRGHAPVTLLDSYEPERIAFAKRLVATTDRVFRLVTSPGRIARFVRVILVPRLFPILARSLAFRRLMFRTVSQTMIHYRASPLSEGRAGRVRGGDRLPWIVANVSSGGQADNFAPLASRDWQVHVYGSKPGPALVEACGRKNLALHTFAWSAAAHRAGLLQGATYLVRPDGYVAFADPEANPARLMHYLDRQGLNSPVHGTNALASEA